jgi:hypothetical protein
MWVGLNDICSTSAKPSEGYEETEAKKDYTDRDFSKSVDSESRKPRISDEGERGITKEVGEGKTKTEETNNDEKNETELGVKREDKAKYEDQRDEVNARGPGEVEASRNPLNICET